VTTQTNVNLVSFSWVLFYTHGLSVLLIRLPLSSARHILICSTFSYKRPAEQNSSIDILTDEELYTLFRNRSNDTAIRAPNDGGIFITDSVWRITEDAVVKVTYSQMEAFMMSYVSSHTSIPIPKICRVLPAWVSEPNSDATWIVMDYVNGTTLNAEWPRMSWWKRLRTMWLARRYIQELRKLPILNPDVPGPFDDSGRSYKCHGYYFTEDGAGPFHSYLDMAAWFNRRQFDVLAAVHSATGVIPRYPKFPSMHSLTLCHMDLHMRNFLVDVEGRIWIIDWANAGAFPAWLEYAHMAIWADAA
jgi:hypothetical protein